MGWGGVQHLAAAFQGGGGWWGHAWLEYSQHSSQHRDRAGGTCLAGVQCQRQDAWLRGLVQRVTTSQRKAGDVVS